MTSRNTPTKSSKPGYGTEKPPNSLPSERLIEPSGSTSTDAPPAWQATSTWVDRPRVADQGTS